MFVVFVLLSDSEIKEWEIFGARLRLFAKISKFVSLQISVSCEPDMVQVWYAILAIYLLFVLEKFLTIPIHCCRVRSEFGLPV